MPASIIMIYELLAYLLQSIYKFLITPSHTQYAGDFYHQNATSENQILM